MFGFMNFKSKKQHAQYENGIKMKIWEKNWLKLWLNNQNNDYAI